MQQLANNHTAINFTYHIIMVFAICTIITLILPFLNFFFIKKSCMCVGGILYLPRTFLRDVGTQLLILFGCWLEIQHKTIPKKVAKKFGLKLLDLQQQVAVSKPKCPIIFKAIMKVNYSKQFSTKLRFIQFYFNQVNIIRCVTFTRYSFLILSKND